MTRTAIVGGPTALFTGNTEGPRGPAASTGFGVFLPGQIHAPNQVLFRYESIGVTILDLTRLRVSAGTLADSNVSLQFWVAPDVDSAASSVGSADFTPASHRAAVSCSVDQLEDGEVLTIVGPASIGNAIGDVTIAFLLSL